jgi:small-conductance mechanosensitive channel
VQAIYTSTPHHPNTGVMGRFLQECVDVLTTFFTDQLFFGIRGSTLVWSALVLALATAAHVGLHLWIGRLARREEQAAQEGGEESRRVHRWLSRGLHAVVPPLALVLWIQGLRYALAIPLAELPSPAAAARALAGLYWAYGLAMVVAVFWLLARVGRLIEAFLLSLSARIEGTWDDVVLPLAGRAARHLLPLLALIMAAPALAAMPELASILRQAASLLLIGVVAYLLFQFVEAASTMVLRQHRLDAADNLQARAVHTQVIVLKRLAMTLIAIFTLASMLMVFESVRQFGASILASAGVAGIILGFAAQRSIAMLLAGFQIALTQPIRVDDVVIVENEWGRIEEITLTYVVVRVWDLRRLVVPITHFIEQPFQNWTRVSADILGTVFLHVDYTVPVDALRAELSRILRASAFWDGNVDVLQVTGATEHTLEVRALASAADASLAWDLRCEIREKLVDFLQRNYPASLPRMRALVEGSGLAAR